MSSRFQLRRLSSALSLVLIALLAMAAGARADGEWKIAEQTMTDLEAPEASIFVSASETLKLSVAWYGSEIECGTLATEAPTKIFPGGTSEAILKLSSCQLLGPPFVAETCELIEPLELKVVGKLLLHGGKTYELFEAPSGKTSLGTIKFKEGTECPLPLSNELKGKFVGETEAGERKEQPLTFSPTVESLFSGDLLSFGTHPATLKGKSTWAMAAGYKGLKWAAVGEESKEAKELEEEELEEEELEEKELKELSSEGDWQLLLNGKVVNELNLQSEFAAGHIFIHGFELSIACTGGTANSKVSGTTTLSLSGTTTFTGCDVVEAEEVCEVSSPGQPDGTIVASGEGTAKSEGSEIITVLLASANFAEILFDGEECFLSEFDITINGSVILTISEALKDLKSHAIHLDEEEIFYGENQALLLTETTEDVPGEAFDENPNATWAIHRVG